MYVSRRNEQDGRSADKRKYESTIQDLEFNKATLERQIKTLESELSARQDELAGLKVLYKNDVPFSLFLLISFLLHRIV